MDLLKQNNEYLARKNRRLVDVICGVVCVFSGFVVGVYTFANVVFVN